MHGNGSTVKRKRCTLCSALVVGLFDGLCLSCQVAEPLLDGTPDLAVVGFLASGPLSVPRSDAPVTVLAELAS